MSVLLKLHSVGDNRRPRRSRYHVLHTWIMGLCPSDKVSAPLVNSSWSKPPGPIQTTRPTRISSSGSIQHTTTHEGEALRLTVPIPADTPITSLLTPSPRAPFPTRRIMGRLAICWVRSMARGYHRAHPRLRVPQVCWNKLVLEVVRRQQPPPPSKRQRSSARQRYQWAITTEGFC